MDHTPTKHERCHYEGVSCPICDGGLFVCSVCGLIEGSLTTECPGYKCWGDEGDDVYEGRKDFRDGEWVAACSPHSPARWNISANQQEGK